MRNQKSSHKLTERLPSGAVLLKGIKIQRIAQSIKTWNEGMREFGECIVMFQTLEDILGTCISKLGCRSRGAGEILLAEMSFRARVSAYGALFTHLKKATLPPIEIKHLIGRLHWAEETRNKLVHSMWSLDERQPEIILRKKKSNRKSLHLANTEDYTLEELQELRTLYEGIATDLIVTTSEHFPRLKIRY